MFGLFSDAVFFSQSMAQWLCFINWTKAHSHYSFHWVRVVKYSWQCIDELDGCSKKQKLGLLSSFNYESVWIYVSVYGWWKEAFSPSLDINSITSNTYLTLQWLSTVGSHAVNVSVPALRSSQHDVSASLISYTHTVLWPIVTQQRFLLVFLWLWRSWAAALIDRAETDPPPAGCAFSYHFLQGLLAHIAMTIIIIKGSSFLPK